MKVKPSALAVFAKSKVKAKAEARRLSQEELEKLIASLNEALKAEKEKTKKKQEKDRVATIRKVNDLLAESGLKPEDLKKNASTARKRKATGKSRKIGAVPAKYRLVIDGKKHEWTGRGRTPKVFQAYFDAGNSRESCAIKS
ncbi:MAG: H-NS histone family protein [Halieaceae bacterium]|jgi:DNA-binding protein H-NS|uniref:H-NS histone family protein n=1 Tax=Haliea alexandrii TaxID=2448162 RepID=UPI000F0B5055|nr:H-NS histone family protein [Haliea alexandrii]MCR9183883.1 H-NS histone family protein [Halieaceae bacterium]